MKLSKAKLDSPKCDSAPGLGSISEFLLRKSREATPRKTHPLPPPFDLLEPVVAQTVFARWGKLCEALFEYLAAEHPDQLLALLSMRIAATDLTFAAEIAGGIDDSAKVRPALLVLFRHHDAVVREGAIYGISRHIDDTVKFELQRLVRSDPSAAVRSAASDLLIEL